MSFRNEPAPHYEAHCSTSVLTPRLRVIPRVQVAHCPADLLYADTRRPSDGEVLAWRRACRHLSTRPSVFVGLTDSLAYRVPYNRPASAMPWGMEGPIAALACRVPVRGTSGHTIFFTIVLFLAALVYPL